MERESLGVRSSSGVGVGLGDGVRTLEIMLLHTELPPSPLFAREKWAEKVFFLLAPSSSESILSAQKWRSWSSAGGPAVFPPDLRKWRKEGF